MKEHTQVISPVAVSVASPIGCPIASGHSTYFVVIGAQRGDSGRIVG